MSDKEPINLGRFRTFTCFWYTAGAQGGPGWEVSLYAGNSTDGRGIHVGFRKDGQLVEAGENERLTAGAAAQVLRRCRQACLERIGYSVGPDLESIRQSARHPAALEIASRAIADAWPRSVETLPTRPAEMLRAICRLAQAIDELLHSPTTAAPDTDPAYVRLGDVSWRFATGADEERFGQLVRELLLTAGAVPDNSWRQGDLLGLGEAGPASSGKAQLVLSRSLAQATERLWQHIDRSIEAVAASAYERGQKEARLEESNASAGCRRPKRIAEHRAGETREE